MQSEYIPNSIHGFFKKNKWQTLALLLTVCILAIQLTFTINDPWMGDYWEHRAVLKELTLYPFRPTHPIIVSNIPHPFFSPYWVAWGYILHQTGSTIERGLDLASMLNAFLLLLSFFSLGRLFLPSVNSFKAYTLLTLMILFCWGVYPLNYSAFYHFATLPWIMPYPSCFSFVCCVFAAHFFQMLVNIKYHSLSKLALSITVIFLLGIGLLAHPLTFFLGIALMLYVLTFRWRTSTSLSVKQHLNSTFAFCLILAAAVGLARLWPYYSLQQLISDTGKDHLVHVHSRKLYSNIYFRYYPLFLIPILLLTGNKNRFSKSIPFLIAIGSLLLLFLSSFLTGSFAFGRTISFIALFGQGLLLLLILDIKSLKRMIYVVSGLLLLCIPYLIHAFSTVIPVLSKSPEYYLKGPFDTSVERIDPIATGQRIRKMESVIGPGQLVLADPVSNKYLPGIGARVICSSFPSYWIPDQDQRKEDLTLFFQTGTTEQKKQILEKYNPKYLLLSPGTSAIRSELADLLPDKAVFNQYGFSLYRLGER